MKALCLVGRSGVGKTTLLERAVATLRGDDRKVLVLKSSHHRLDDDAPGSDSWRLSQAGAQGVVLRGVDGLRLSLDPPPSLEELLTFLAPRFEVALIEGGKGSTLPKVELLAGEPPLLPRDQVVGQLRRGLRPDDPEPVKVFLDWLERKGQLVETAKP